MKVHLRNNVFLANAVLIYGAHLNPDLSEYIFHDRGGLTGQQGVRLTSSTFIVLNGQKIRTNDFLRLKLPLGESSFIYKNKEVKVTHTTPGGVVGCGTGPDIYQQITIEAEADIIFFDELVKDARDFYNNSKNKSEIITYIHNQGNWQRLSKLHKRRLDTIYLPQNVLKEITDDVNTFLNSRKIYDDLCIPYKRNYLFEGIPGTGKTSLIFALASKFDKNIAIMNFNLDVDDATFMKAISRLPENCILVLEDIDTLFVERKSGDSNKSMISFSGLLNTLDGIARKEEQLTFLTTNYITKLDKALIRPGRIDKTMSFTFAAQDQIQLMFEKFFPEKKDMWKKFKKSIRRIKTTTAVLQSFFFKHMNNDINEHIEEFRRMSLECRTSNIEKDLLYS